MNRWSKGETNFDVTMGAFDRAEICKLIGTFMLSLLSKHINKNHMGYIGMTALLF